MYIYIYVYIYRYLHRENVAAIRWCVYIQKVNRVACQPPSSSTVIFGEVELWPMPIWI